MTEYDYGDDQSEPDISDFDELNDLVRTMRQEELALEELEEKVVAKKERVKDLSERQLPDLMERMGLTQFVTKQGFKVEMKDKVFARIPEECRVQALQWLKDNGAGAIVRHDFKLSFKLSQRGYAEKARLLLEDSGLPYKEDPNVHHATLTSFAREKLEKGEELPESLFSVVQNKTVNIK